MKKDIDFIKNFFIALTANKIEYCILRKADTIFSGSAHDIDMVVNFSEIMNVYKILTKLSKELGWELFFKIIKDNGNLVAVHYYTIYDKHIYIVHLDLFNNFSWNTIPVLKNKELLKKRIEKDGVYSCSESIEAITKLFSRYLYHEYIKDDYKDDILTLFLNNNFEVVREMSIFLDKDLADLIYDLVIVQDWNGLIAIRPKVLGSIQSKYYISLLHKVTVKLRSKVFKLKRYFIHKGIMVAILGTDGSGKSTIIKNLPIVLERTFNESQIKYYHWRPKYIKSPKGDNGYVDNVKDPHKKKPYGKIVSFCKFMYFNLDYIFGYWLSVKVYLGKSELVIFDRYYYDYMIDKYRYRLNLSEGIINAFIRFIPKPDITFLLDGDPKIFYERKKELPLEELEKQVSRLLMEKDKIPNSKLIDVNQITENVVFDVSKYILEFMKERELEKC